MEQTSPRQFILPLLLGIAITLILRGYQFGGGNHSVYLVAPLREVDPTLLANDWWTTKTLQYHIAYTHMTALFMRLGIERPAFLVLYLALVVMMHIAWIRIALDLGLDWRAYLLSVPLYYLSAGGTGLGSYMFLQDSSFLPGNVANVAMLWGVRCWIAHQTWPAAISFAIAGLFHLNHALIGIGFWAVQFAVGFFDRERWQRRSAVQQLAAFALIIAFSLPNILPAAKLVLTAHAKLPLDQFVDLYVKLRHPHHYHPLSWPLALWLSFLWPIPLAILGWKKTGYVPVFSRAAFAFLFYCALLCIAFLFAGVVFISEPLIQMSLFRFSIYPKLLACIGAAAFFLDPATFARKSVRIAMIAVPVIALTAVVIIRIARASTPAALFINANILPLALFLIVTLASVILIARNRSILHPLLSIIVFCALLAAVFGNWLGLTIDLHDRSDNDYLALCHYARDHTPKDAIFLVPPNEQLFRFHARRAIVVNFKGVPQLSSEMLEWRNRLRDVLNTDPALLAQRFDQTQKAMAERYDTRSVDHLVQVARKYNARYVVTAKPIPMATPIFEKANAYLYDLNDLETLR